MKFTRLDKLQSEFSTFRLDRRLAVFPEEIEDPHDPSMWGAFPELGIFHGRLRAAWKFRLLVLEVVGNAVKEGEANYLSDDFDFSEVDWDMVSAFEHLSDDEVEEQYTVIQTDSEDFTFLPMMQDLLAISTCIALVETLLKSLCETIAGEESIKYNPKGSYVQRYDHYLRKHSSIKIPKRFLRIFTSFGHLRNSFLHQLQPALPDIDQGFMNELTGPFVDIRKGVKKIHVDLCLRLTNEFGDDLQTQLLNYFGFEITQDKDISRELRTKVQ